jgi:Restriction endonuclease
MFELPILWIWSATHLSEETVPEGSKRRIDMANTPIAYGVPIDLVLDQDALARLTATFAKSSAAECFLGPGWVSDTGIATFIVITPNGRWVNEVKRAGQCAVLAWRWDSTPSMYVSLTVMSARTVEGVAARWMRPSDDPVIQAIRREARMRFCVALPSGKASPWMEATFRSSADSNEVHRGPLERLWEIPVSGIPWSRAGVRFDPLRRKPLESKEGEQIPFWAEPVADFWATLEYDGPWADDRSAADRARAAWGKEAWRKRAAAAGYIQVLIDEQRLDGKAPAFDASGQLTLPSASEGARKFALEHSQIALWLAALAGPDPSPKRAHEIALSVLRNPSEVFAWIIDTWRVLDELDDLNIQEALKTSFAAAVRDATVTRAGTCRPWLTNAAGGFSLQLKCMPIDLGAPLVDVESLWMGGLDVLDLIEMGLRVTGAEFPRPFELVCKDLEGVRLDGSVEEAQQSITQLLREAQEARQWSVPWGARVDVHFGCFVGLRIFERDGEFSCHFLDDKDRYFHVAIGLRDPQPKAVSERLLKLNPDSGEPEWNEEGECSLKLIAAAIVRDFLVVEERETLFTSRPFRRRIGSRDLRSIIYLPRVRYSRARVEGQAGKPEDGSAHRARHTVAPHLRRAGEASAAQRFLAQRYGFLVPQGFTFVRPHERGRAAELERIRLYRSRSASRMIFEAIETAPEGTRPAWFDFEKDCARLLKQRGMEVIHQAANRDGDGGVDLYAIDAEGGSWVVQCKCWAPHRKVSPHVVRELKGAIELADAGSEKHSGGMIITTSTFTDEATRAAGTFGFELIDGSALARMLSSGWGGM